MRSIVTLDSKIFDRATRGQKLQSFVNRQAKEFKRLTQTRMIESKATGVIVPRRKVSRYGPGFERRHQRSSRGQRPAIETTNLMNAVDDRQTSETSAEVFIQPRPNPETGQSASEYGEILQEKLGRRIMDEQDAADAQTKMLQDANVMLRDLI
jgi:hypothetical protein